MENLFSIAPLGPARAAAGAAAVPSNPKSLFHPVEHAILRQFFRLRPRRSDPQQLFQPAMPKSDAAAPPYIGIDPCLDEHGLENAVARLCLGAIQQRLPQWGAVHADGRIVLGRNRYARTERAIEPKPVYLFMINWADSGPGFSWPVAYHATWIPGYGRWVVTGSADSPDVWGCTDIAIGWFRGTDIRAGAGRVIRSEWRKAYTGYDQAPWAYLFGSGLVPEEESLAWRVRVWRGHEEL